MNKRKLYIPSLIGFFFTILISQNVSFSQSKKKQIEALNFKIDSFNLVIANERNTQKTSIGSLEIQEFKSKQKVDSLTKEINSVENQISSQKKEIKNNTSQLNEFKNLIEKQKEKYNNTYQIENLQYNSINIGSQIWMKNNLDVITFKNGDPIQEANTKEDWQYFSNQGIPAWCYFNNDANNGKKYGKLYNWYAVNDPRGLAPLGWHISTKSEWEKVNKVLGEGSEWIAGWKLRSEFGWTACNGNNSTGFSALPGGKYNEQTEFENYFDETNSLGWNGYWWTRTEFSNTESYYIELNGGCMDGGMIGIYKGTKYQGMSVRCVKD